MAKRRGELSSHGQPGLPKCGGCSQCTGWGIGKLECLQGSGGGGRVGAGLSRTSAFTGWAMLKGETQPGLDRGPQHLGQDYSQPGKKGPLAGALCRKEGLHLQSGLTPKMGPPAQLQMGRCHPLCPHPGVHCCLCCAGLVSTWRDKMTSSRGPRDHLPTPSFSPPHSLRSCLESLWWKSRLLQHRAVEQLWARRQVPCIRWQLCETLGKSLLSDP